MSAYSLASLVSRKYAVISVNEEFNQAFLQAIKGSGSIDRMTSMMTIGKPLKLPMVDFYTPEELEDELLRIGHKQVEEDGVQLIVIACSVISILLSPGAFARLSEKLGVTIVDPQKSAIKMAEMLVQIGL